MEDQSSALQGSTLGSCGDALGGIVFGGRISSGAFVVLGGGSTRNLGRMRRSALGKRSTSVRSRCLRRGSSDAPTRYTMNAAMTSAIASGIIAARRLDPHTRA